MSSELKGNTFHLARCEIRINGKIVAIGGGFSYTRAPIVSEVWVNNRMHRADAPIVGYRHNISIQTVKSVGKGMVALGMVPNVGGTHEQQLNAAIAFGETTVDIYDSKSKTKQYECEGVTPTSIGENTPMGSHSQGSWSASCDRVLMEGEY